MANEKVSALTELTGASKSDILYVVDDPGGSPVSRKITISNFMAATKGEIFLTAAGGWPSTASGCAGNRKREYPTNDMDLFSLDFDSATSEYAQWSIGMPNFWDGGTITFDAAWTAASSGGSIVLGLQGRSYADDNAIDAAWGTAQTVTDQLTAINDICVTPESAAITLGGSPAAGRFTQFRVYRDTEAGGDTLATDALLLGVKIRYDKS